MRQRQFQSRDRLKRGDVAPVARHVHLQISVRKSSDQAIGIALGSKPVSAFGTMQWNRDHRRGNEVWSLCRMSDMTSAKLRSVVERYVTLCQFFTALALQGPTHP
jgi:hypothetical protein